MPPPDDEVDEAAAAAAHRADGQRLTEEIKRRITPQLEEMGVSGFLLAGYITLGDGSKSRVMMVCDGGDPATRDGLSRPAFACAIWSGLISGQQAP